jgi:hypothetical protein
VDNHSPCGLSARGLDLPDEGVVSLFLKMGLVEDTGLVSDTERTVAEVATSESMIHGTKYPDEPPGSGTSSREAKGKPISKETCDPATENVGDCRPLLSVP